MERKYSKAFYDSRAWINCRNAFMSSKHYVCEGCGGVAVIAHHVVNITPGNINNLDITLNWDNLEALCVACHNIAHGLTGHNKPHGSYSATSKGIGFDANGNVITETVVYLVCGSPAAGKSTYVSENKTMQDLVIDMDYICAALQGEPNNIYSNHEPVLGAAVEVRTLLYSIVRERRGSWRKAFVITSIANVTKQKELAAELKAELILIDTPLDECLARLHADQRRGNKLRFESIIRKWHKEYMKSVDVSV